MLKQFLLHLVGPLAQWLGEFGSKDILAQRFQDSRGQLRVSAEQVDT